VVFLQTRKALALAPGASASTRLFVLEGDGRHVVWHGSAATEVVARTTLGNATAAVTAQGLCGCLDNDLGLRQMASCAWGSEVWWKSDMMTTFVRARTFNAERVADEEAA
jgi:hypothetical protein